MNREAFFNALRGGAMFPRGYAQGQVEGLDAILDEGERRGTSRFHLAYMLATAYHETAATMQPVRETMASTDGRAILILEKSWKAGKLPWVSTPYWRKDKDGKSWLGRGLVQLTWRDNYEKMAKVTGVDLVANPSRAMDMAIAVKIMFEGMVLGSFTGKKLSDYITDAKADYYNARRIINGTDRAAHIAVQAKAFEAALVKAGYEAKPAPVSDIQAPSFDLNPKPATSTKETTAFWPALARYLLTLWKGRQA